MAEPKKPRAKRRNYEQEMRTLRMHCEISTEVLEQLIANPSLTGCNDLPVIEKITEFNRGQLAALRSVLTRMNGDAK